MTTPRDGDFASQVNELANRVIPEQKLTSQEQVQSESQASQVIQWLNAGVPELSAQEEQKLIDELQGAEVDQDSIEPLSGEEFERQALEAGGDDNDPNTPE